MDHRFDITFDKVSRAAEIYFVEKAGKYRRYWNAYQKVNCPALRDKLLYDPNEDSLNRVIGFLNNWRCRLSYESFRPVLLNALDSNLDDISFVCDGNLQSCHQDKLKMRVVQGVFLNFLAGQGIGPTVASKILGILNPDLFVMWDGPIQEEYGYRYRSKPDYSRFIVKMGEEAQRVVESCGSGDPVGELSVRYGERFGGPFPLSSLINYYLWLTFTQKEEALNPQLASPRGTKHEIL